MFSGFVRWGLKLGAMTFVQALLQKPSIRPSSALGGGKGPVEAGPAPERFELAARPVDPAVEPALHHHDGVYSAGARPGDRFDGQAPVVEEGVEYAPREGAVGPAALKGERHGLFGARPRETAGLARMASSAAGHRAVPLEVLVMNDALVIDAPEGRETKYLAGAGCSAPGLFGGSTARSRVRESTAAPRP